MTDTKKKILLASPLPPPYSGYEKITECILRSDLAQKFDIIHVNTSNNRETGTRGHFNLTNLLAGLKKLAALFAALAVHRPAVANIPIARNWTGFLKYSSYILLAALFRCRIVSRLGGDNFDVFYSQSSTLFRWYIVFVLKQIDILIVRADRLREQFSGVIDPEKLRTVYLGFDVDHDPDITFADNQPADSKKNNETVNVLFLGYISKAKGALDLLDSIKRVVAQNKNVRFIFAGPMIREEKNIVHINNPKDTEVSVRRILEKSCCQDHIRFLGEVIGRQKTDAFMGADIFVLPSYSEGFPFVVLEAMAAGLPLITTRVGALPEVLEDGKHVLFVQTGAPDELAEKIVALAENSQLRRRMGTENRRLVKEKFNLTVFAQQMEKIYNDV